MYKNYYVNNDQTWNPGLHHEVHTKEHAAQLGIRSAHYVGYYASEGSTMLFIMEPSVYVQIITANSASRSHSSNTEYPSPNA